MSEQFDSVSIERDDRVATVELDRPASRNALTVETLHELADALEALMTADDTNVIVLTGSGDEAFASGADLQMFHEQTGTWFKRDFRRAFARVEDAIENGPKPVVAAVNGNALGGGLELAVTCDLIYAAESANLGVPEMTLGGMPGAGGTQRLAHLLGYLKAKELVMTGRPIPASEAAEIGLVLETFDDSEFYARVYDIAQTLADRAPYALWFSKEVINGARAELDSGLALEAALGGLLFETDDLHEGFGAFLEGRDPDFSDWKDV